MALVIMSMVVPQRPGLIGSPGWVSLSREGAPAGRVPYTR